jgi:hypothetical protein
LAREIDADISSSRALYTDVAPTIARFSPDMTTRVIVLGDEPDLVEALLKLERAEHQWRVWIEAVEHSGAPDAFAWREALGTLVAATTVYGYFVIS